MAHNADNVRSAPTGSVYADLTGALSAPTGTETSLALWSDLGYANEDGVVLSFPGGDTAEPIRAWQGSAVVRTIRTPSDESPTIAVTFLETKPDVIKTVFGVEITQTGTEGQWDYVASASRTPIPLAIDVLDGDEHWRIYAPKATVIEIGEVNLTSTGVIGFSVTFACDQGAGGYNLRSWMTDLADDES